MVTAEVPIDISLIEHFSFCPDQARLILTGFAELPEEMLEGEDEHKKRCVRDKFKVSIQQGTFKGDNKAVVLACIRKALSSRSLLRFSEVYVESANYGMRGYVDEVRVENGKIFLTEYKTTFKWDEQQNYRSAAVDNQLSAYAIAFREYFDILQPLFLLAKRVYLRSEGAYSAADVEADTTLGSLNRDDTMLANTWSADASQTFINTIYSGQVEWQEAIRSILDRIRREDFSHDDSRNRCMKCQYNMSCEHSMIQ